MVPDILILPSKNNKHEIYLPSATKMKQMKGKAIEKGYLIEKNSWSENALHTSPPTYFLNEF